MAVDRTVTVKASGGDYDSLSAALVAEQALLVSLDRRLIIECYDMVDTTQVNTDGQTWSTDATRYVWIKAVSDHAGAWSTSVYRHEYGGITYAMNLGQIAFGIITGMQFRYTGGNSGVKLVEIDSDLDGGTWYIQKCIAIGDGAALATSGFYARQSGNYKFSNCLIYGCSGDAIPVGSSTANVWVDGCTIDDCATGIDTAAASRVRVRDTRITNCTTVIDEISGALHTDSNYNLTDSAAPTNWGANSLDSTDTPTIDYVDDSNATMTSRDYHMNSASDSAYDAGVDLSGDGDNPFSDDIDSHTRSRWDIGADEYNSGGVVEGGSAPMISVFATAIQRASSW